MSYEDSSAKTMLQYSKRERTRSVTSNSSAAGGNNRRNTTKTSDLRFMHLA